MNDLPPARPAPARWRGHPRTTLLLAALASWGLYQALAPVATALSESIAAALGLAPQGQAAAALAFFLYDLPKVLLLLTGVVFAMGMVNTWFTPQRTRALLARRGETGAGLLAAGLGVVTPFCSCSAVPLFVGFVQAGVPLGVTFTFLVAAPMVNEVALALLLGLFGWRIAALYLVLGLGVAIAAGAIIGRLRMERHLEPWVRELPRAPTGADEEGHAMTLATRMACGADNVRNVLGRVWPYLIAGIGVGAGIHGWVPQDAMAALMGQQAWWSVPLAVLAGVPLYSNAAGVIPIVQALLAKGAALGTVLAFMMSVIALSLPELVLLRQVLRQRLIATFVAVVTSGILAVGLIFNAVL